MRGVKITPDLIIATGMSIALIIAVSFGRSPEITGVIAGGLAGYLGQVISSDDGGKKKEKDKERQEGGADERRTENY
jgi:hypothetical protein